MKITKQLFACVSLMLVGLGVAHADYALNLMKGVTQVSNDIYDLHMLILWICVFIGAGVFGVMFYSIFHHRKSKGHQAAQFHENTTVEIIWTIIPTLILIGMAIPATKTLLELDQVQDPDMSIKVTGYQWFWEYEYLDDDKNPDNNLRFFSKLDEESNKVRQVHSGLNPVQVANYLLNVDKPLVIPVNKKVRFLFTSKDVIHSWWVPDFGWKKDANPGFINEAWTYVTKPGTYRGQCTELCGKDHGFMPIVVIVKEQADYDKWLAQQHEQAKASSSDKEWTKDELVAEGAKVYEKNCASCHMADGAGVPGTFPAMTKSPVVTGAMDGQVQLMINGKGMMPAFGKNKMLNATELAQVITYTRNALGNKVGDAIQPKAIQEALGGKAATASESKPAAKEEAKAEKAADAKEAKEDAKPKAKDKSKAGKAEKVEKIAKVSKEDLMAEGKEVYEKNCASCHGAEGSGTAGLFPALTDSKVVKGDIKAQAKIMSAGKGMMPAFGEILNDKDFAAVVTYTRNGLGNKVGDAMQPDEVQALQSAQK